MLKILCCVKQVPDVDQMRMDPETGNLIRAGVPAILNPQDANALSAAVKVKEQYGAEITLITMGPPNAEAALRECLAAGADKAVLVTDRAFGNADTLATSYSIMSAAATQGSYDMIFCGKESLDGATGQMGAQLAQRFGAAQVTSTLLIKEVNEEARTAVVERELEDGIETLEVKLPCLFTIEKQNYPARIPNLSEEETAAVVEKFKALVEANGTLEEMEEMGKRKLAYEINYISEGYYVLMKFTSAPEFPAELDRILGITDGILRRLITLRAE